MTMMSADDKETGKWQAGRRRTVLRLRFPQPSGSLGTCLLWDQRGLQVEHLTYFPRRLQVLCLSRSFLGVSCRSQLKNFFLFFLRKWKALEPQNKKKSSRAMALSGFGAKPHIGRTAATCRLKCRDFWLVYHGHFNFDCFMKKDQINKNRHPQGKGSRGGKANFFSLCNGKQTRLGAVSDVAARSLVSSFSWCVKCIPYVNHGLKILFTQWVREINKLLWFFPCFT